MKSKAGILPNFLLRRGKYYIFFIYYFVFSHNKRIKLMVNLVYLERLIYWFLDPIKFFNEECNRCTGDRYLSHGS